MSSKVYFDFGFIEFYENFAVGEMYEGADVSAEEHMELSKTMIEYYKEKPFGYISNRKCSYAVDPRAYTTTSQIKNLMAISVVTTNPAQRLSASVEELFFGRPFQYFNSLAEAKNWMKKTINPEASVRSA